MITQGYTSYADEVTFRKNINVHPALNRCLLDDGVSMLLATLNFTKLKGSQE